MTDSRPLWNAPLPCGLNTLPQPRASLCCAVLTRGRKGSGNPDPSPSSFLPCTVELNRLVPPRTYAPSPTCYIRTFPSTDRHSDCI